MKLAIRGEIFAAFDHPVLAAIVGDEAARFLDQEDPGRNVPDVEIVFPEAVEPTRRDPGEVEARGAQAADARHFGCDRAEDPAPVRDIAATEMRNAGPDQRLVEIAPRRHAQAAVVKPRAPALFGPEALVGQRLIDQAVA